MSDVPLIVVRMTTVLDLRTRPFDTSANGAVPAFLHMKVSRGTVKVGVSREDATEFLNSNPFQGGVAVMSLSSWAGTSKREMDTAEALSVLRQLFDGEVLPLLRIATMGAGALYVLGLTVGDSFVGPTPLQDAVLRHQLNCAPLLPA
jgi:hypothetical protein